MILVSLCEVRVPTELSLANLLGDDVLTNCVETWPDEGPRQVQTLHVVPGPSEIPDPLDAELLAGADLLVVNAAEQPGGDILAAMLSMCRPELPLIMASTGSVAARDRIRQKIDEINGTFHKS